MYLEWQTILQEGRQLVKLFLSYSVPKFLDKFLLGIPDGTYGSYEILEVPLIKDLIKGLRKNFG